MGGMIGKNAGPNILNPFGASNPLKAMVDPLGMFSRPSNPASPLTPPPAPTVDNSQGALDAAALQEQQALARGRASTILTSGAGLSNMGTASKVLLGQ